MKRGMIVLSVVLFSITNILGQTEIPKAQSMFIYNFSRLIEWPADYKTGNFVIGVLGSASIYGELESYTASKKVGIQSIQVERYRDPAEIGKCHILFIPFGKSNNISDVLAKIGSQSTLIIGEKRGMIEDGAAINFVIIENSLKFELSPSNATKHGLKVSSSLQNMAILK